MVLQVPRGEEFAGTHKVFVETTTEYKAKTYLPITVSLIDPCASETISVLAFDTIELYYLLGELPNTRIFEKNLYEYFKSNKDKKMDCKPFHLTVEKDM